MTQTHRSDGLNNPMSINSGIGCTWSAAEQACEKSDAVESYSRDGGSMLITWCDGNVSTCCDPQAALSEIRQMS